MNDWLSRLLADPRPWIMEWLDPVGVVIGILIAIPIFWTWWEVAFGRRRASRHRHRRLIRNPGSQWAVALVIDLLPGKDIRSAVLRHRASGPALREIPDDRVLHVRRDQLLTPDQTYDYAVDVRRRVADLIAMGVDTIHLYYAGPDVGAVMVGAELANGPRVFLYHYQGGSYQRYSELRPHHST